MEEVGEAITAVIPKAKDAKVVSGLCECKADRQDSSYIEQYVAGSHRCSWFVRKSDIRKDMNTRLIMEFMKELSVRFHKTLPQSGT